jgi:hypothetical protein
VLKGKLESEKKRNGRPSECKKEKRIESIQSGSARRSLMFQREASASIRSIRPRAAALVAVSCFIEKQALIWIDGVLASFLRFDGCFIKSMHVRSTMQYMLLASDDGRN